MNPLSKLPRSFYLQSTLTVATELLGKLLVRRHNGVLLAGRIVETEAYLGSRDPASHAYRGRTPRNDVMFWIGGHLYVYFTYGMHYCANVVTAKEGTAEAVLIRALEPVRGIEVMKRNRGGFVLAKTNAASLPTRISNGPAKLCEALGIRREDNGTDLWGTDIYLLDAPRIPRTAIGRSSRIGISKGKEHKWRFFIKGNEWVSR